MSLKEYLKDKLVYLVVFVFALFLIFLILFSFNISVLLIIYIFIILIIAFMICFTFDFLRRNFFYKNINMHLDSLDKKYLITEMIKKPGFYEGNMLYDYLYDIDKSMLEEINNYKISSSDFKDYLEAWIHEIKTPIATSKLIIFNNKNIINKSVLEEIDKIDTLTEQIMYYARSSTLEKDYIITKLNINSIINDVIKEERKDILNRKIKINMFNDVYYVNSDLKWLKYIIKQIILNCIKYTNNDGSITFKIKSNKNNTILSITDTGIGIKNEEIKKVFDKGFTGSNGRKGYNSTGFGLYLVKKLMDKLNHNIEIISNIDKGTTVYLIFPNGDETSII